MADLTQVTQGASRAVGRYFSVVSTLPSALLVAWVFLLGASGAWTRSPSPRDAWQSATSLSIGTIGGLAVAAVALGVILHPLQFAFVQVLEGYWGVSAIAQRWRSRRIIDHRRRLVGLRDTAAEANESLGELPDDPSESDPASRVVLFSLRDEADRLAGGRPRELEETMPTRLGNVLRFYERAAGAPYSLDTVRVMPFLALVAPQADIEYVDDQRSQLDLAVRTIIVSMVAFVVTALPLLTDGLWLLVALAPYSAAYLSYRGAVVAAEEYGRSLAVVIALNRFALYERLRVPMPADTRAEREQNQRFVGPLLGYSTADRVSHHYGPEPEPDPGSPDDTPTRISDRPR